MNKKEFLVNTFQNTSWSMKPPLYLQVQETLKEMIEGTEYAPGDQIPSERELAEILRVSRMTARRAVESLVEAGLLERRSTSGTYVREPQVIRNISPNTIQSLTRQIQGEGGQPGSKLLVFESLRAPKKVAEYLNERLGVEVYCIRRLRFTNDLPFCIETSYLPVTRFPGLSKQALTGDASLYHMLETRYDVRATRSMDTLNVSFATDEEAQYLELESNAPVIFFRSIIYDEQGLPFEYVKSINHPYRVAFQAVTEVKDQQLRSIKP
jgi:GntR family transcriptional regulator